jgi:radical SAM superfamily enzyme YgiQ (UPF0313 family)
LLSDIDEYLLDLKEARLISWEIDDFLDVLLVAPPFPSIYSSQTIEMPEFSAPPLGLAYLAAVLRSSDYRVEIYDMHIVSAQPEDAIKKYRQTKPKIVAFTATTPSFPNAIRTAKLLKAWNKDVCIVFGGAHATSSPEECLNTGVVDYVVIGEGEFVLLQLVKYKVGNNIDINQINGISYRDSAGNVVSNPHQVRTKDLDVLPFPSRDLLDLDKYYQKGSIISSRGCPYQCTYCSCALIAGYQNRIHSVGYVISEIEYMIQEYGIKYFDFHDDTFNLHEERVIDICNEIINRKISIKWGCFCRADNFNLELAQKMKAAGCEVIQFGVEAGNKKVLDAIKKKVSLEQIEQAVCSASEAGIKHIACGFIIGHSDDTEESAYETIEFGL